MTVWDSSPTHDGSVFEFLTDESEEKLFKQVDGTWYWFTPPDEVNWESLVRVNDWKKSEKFQLMFLTQNQLMRFGCPCCNALECNEGRQEQFWFEA